MQAGDVEVPWCAAGDLGGQAPVVLLAGLGWRATGCVLSGYPRPGLPVLGLDFPRRWPRRPLDSMGALAEVYAEALAALGHARVRLVGVSTGGLVALELTLRRPDLVESLAMVSSAATGRHVDRWRLAASRAAAGLLPRVSFDGFYRRWGPRLVGAASFFTPREAARLWVDPISRRKLAALLRAIARFDARAHLGEVRCRSLVIHGERDVIIPAAAARELAEGLGATRLAVVEGAGHFVFLTCRERVLGELERFWNQEETS